MVYPLSLEEDTYEDSLALLAELEQPRLNIASGEDLFNEQGEHLYAPATC